MAVGTPGAYVSEQTLTKTIFASASGTMIEWYDFYIFGSLAAVIASKFYQTGTPLGDLIAFLATFAIGFIVRPFGAIFFGRIGDLIGRKYTFLITMTLMGLCTFLVGLLPTADVIGPLAGIILITLRILQVLALFGATMGQGVVWYTGQFYALFYLQTVFKVPLVDSNVVIGAALLIGTPFFIFFGWLSDRIGRKPIILAGMLLAVVTYYPIY